MMTSREIALEKQFDLLKESWQKEKPSIATRIIELQALHSTLKNELPQMVQAISSDFGLRVSEESLLSDGMTTLAEISHLIRNIKRWSKPRRASAGWRLWPARAEIRPVPLGVVGILSPWNYPINLALVPLATAVAAGNHVFLKPSEKSPHSSQFLSQLLSKVFPPNRVAVVQGDADLAREFSQLPFDHLFFTGSTAVGRKVMEAAARQLTPVTLELGGKSPALICDDFPIAKAAARISTGKWFNAGQTCIAPDYILISEKRVDELVQALQKEVEERYHTPEKLETRFTRIINRPQYDRLVQWRDEAEAMGARVIPLIGESHSEKNLIPPTLILNPSDQSTLMREEIFGPLLPLITCSSLDEAIEIIQSKPRPLALYPFTNSKKNLEIILQSIVAGGVTVNDTLLHFAATGLPFGGVGASGIGAYHGQTGFDRMSHLLPIVRQRKRATTDQLRPPYEKKKKLIDFIIRSA